MRVTTPGGGRSYNMVRSKYVKGKDGYGKMITAVREKYIASHGGKDPGPNTVVHHERPGSHYGGKEGPTRAISRGENAAISNKLRRVKKLKDKIKTR